MASAQRSSSVAASLAPPRIRAGQLSAGAARMPSSEPKAARSVDAATAPKPGRPGNPSAASPTRASQSGIAAGATPHFARTPASSKTRSRRRSRRTTRSPRTHLGEVLVGRADEDLLDARVGREAERCRRQRVVRLELDHRPERDPERDDRLLRHGELGQEVGGARPPRSCSRARGRCGTSGSPGRARRRRAWRPRPRSSARSVPTSPATAARGIPSRPRTAGRGAWYARKSS